MTKDYAVKRLQTIVNHSGDAYDYEIKVRNWENYGKSRTYLSIVETSKTSKHYVERKYGYIDNQTGEYIPEKNDLNDNFTFSRSSRSRPCTRKSYQTSKAPRAAR